MKKLKTSVAGPVIFLSSIAFLIAIFFTCLAFVAEWNGYFVFATLFSVIFGLLVLLGRTQYLLEKKRNIQKEEHESRGGGRANFSLPPRRNNYFR